MTKKKVTENRQEELARVRELLAQIPELAGPNGPLSPTTTNRTQFSQGSVGPFNLQQGRNPSSAMPNFEQALPTMAVPSFAAGFGYAPTGVGHASASLILPENVVPRLGGIPSAGRMVEFNEEMGLVAFYSPCYIGSDFFIRQKGEF